MGDIARAWLERRLEYQFDFRSDGTMLYKLVSNSETLSTVQSRNI